MNYVLNVWPGARHKIIFNQSNYNRGVSHQEVRLHVLINKFRKYDIWLILSCEGITNFSTHCADWLKSNYFIVIAVVG